MMVRMLNEEELGVVVMAMVVVGAGSLSVVLGKGRAFLMVREWCRQDEMDGVCKVV